ncbi:M15 family metallopeptidase [Microbacterium sp. CFBP9034]|uniref:M15 family metallopeptidase n=1 Tax=Microbacterium sp. CFBP9034 TaxID=3096540 RepID=UPI002A69CB97|nr:M15 family metallopeptidase [Microbacterium sp. CFBP9034]MDY0907976.1 M15 family metallopeptidase [Microbacterium sp. CFBP9034]
MTAPDSPETPTTRRAARAMREGADGRAPEVQPGATAPAEPPFLLPEDVPALALPPEVHVARPASLPSGFAATPAAPPARPSTAPQQRVRGSRRARRPDRRHSARRAARAQAIEAGGNEGPPARHVRPRRLTRVGVAVVLALGGALLLGSTAAVTALVTGATGVEDPSADAVARMAVAPPTATALPVPKVAQTPVSADICADPEFMTAVEKHQDESAVVAAGGGEAFRAAVVGGDAPCVDLDDPTRIWAVINKARPYDPIDYRPSGLMMPDGVRSLEGGSLRADAASALTSLVTAAREAGVGELALESGFRSYETQQGSYGRQVDSKGAQQADLVSARPGFSEHQSGLTGDVVACSGGCSTLDDLAATSQGAWVAEHAWEHGWIVRYVEGATGVTGYLPEPWHLRFIGPELARAYHDGGWRTLEEFFGLAPAPAYLG